MLKFLLRALFKPTYRSQTKPSRKPVRETLAYKAGRSITVSSAQSKTLEPDASNAEQSHAPTTVEVFDETSSHSVTAPRVLEGPAYVTDGDTITIRKTQIRLFGIDAPELHHPYGKKAKWAMVRLCKGHKIRAEITAEDQYGRTVAKCFLPDGRDLSEELVKQGLAIDWPKFSGGKYSSFEVAGIRKKLWLTDARQKGRMHVWEKSGVRESRENNDK
ncbi:thermonuclease family protein [Phaeobacter italicus]|jgi:endonuclease YncB( thermonuclease family)|uniref:thermonuclease family protein n=1 Tax=Phaeobacter italicus TaxID=481446 RepID=UPI0023311233|nr:thermonuclease family protein [Phaeobacter italicus]